MTATSSTVFGRGNSGLNQTLGTAAFESAVRLNIGKQPRCYRESRGFEALLRRTIRRYRVSQTKPVVKVRHHQSEAKR